MAWNDPNELIVAGTGQASVAPVGTAQPANADSALNAAFNGLGYHTEDGASINESPGISEVRAWQSKYPVRRDRTTDDFQITFALEQWNEVNVPLAFGGGDIVSLGGSQYRYDPPTPDDALDSKILVVDVQDGARKVRFVVPKGSAIEAVESQFTSENPAVLPITFKALEPDDAGRSWYALFNDAAAFAAGS